MGSEPSSLTEPALQRLPNIQILRACAALMIVVHHCGVETARLAALSDQPKLFNENPWGWGVSLFFVISGFIMVVTAGGGFGSPRSACDFVRRRIIRIVPLYWLVTTLALATLLMMPNLMKIAADDYTYVVASYLFWPMMRLTGDVRPLATPGWTLNLEMLFYLTFAVALLFRRRIGFAVLFGSLGLLVMARVSGMLPGVALNFWGDPIVINFLSGVLIGVAYNNGIRIGGTTAMTLAAIGVTMLFIPMRPTGAEDDLMPRLVEMIPSIIVLIGLALGPQLDESRRAWRLPLLIGDASYSLYLVHEFLLRPQFLLWKKFQLLDVASLWAFVPVALAISVTIALLTYRYFERPVTVWLNAKKIPDVRFAGLRGAAGTQQTPAVG